MTPAELTAKLATHTPRLLTCQEAGMSEGPIRALDTSQKVDMGRGQSVTVIRFALLSADDKEVGGVRNEANARYIAAASTWAELLWRNYDEFRRVFKDYVDAQNFEQGAWIKSQMTEILLALDAAGRLGWVEKEKANQ